MFTPFVSILSLFPLFPLPHWFTVFRSVLSHRCYRLPTVTGYPQFKLSFHSFSVLDPFSRFLHLKESSFILIKIFLIYRSIYIYIYFFFFLINFFFRWKVLVFDTQDRLIRIVEKVKQGTMAFVISDQMLYIRALRGWRAITVRYHSTLSCLSLLYLLHHH